jgi:hypothetical protein
MSHATLQKTLLVSTCILSVFTLTTLWFEASGRPGNPRPQRSGGFFSLEEEIQRRLPEDDLKDHSFIRKIRNLLNCNSSFAVSLDPNFKKICV